MHNIGNQYDWCIWTLNFRFHATQNQLGVFGLLILNNKLFIGTSKGTNLQFITQLKIKWIQFV